MSQAKARHCVNTDIRNSLLVKLHVVHQVSLSDLADMFHIKKRHAKKILKDSTKLGGADNKMILAELSAIENVCNIKDLI